MGVENERPWRPAPGGLSLTVRLTPKGGRDAIEGVEARPGSAPVLKARVRAAPHEGAANEALAALIGKTLGVAPSRVELTSGATARVKTLRIAGDAGALALALERLTGRLMA